VIFPWLDGPKTLSEEEAKILGGISNESRNFMDRLPLANRIVCLGRRCLRGTEEKVDHSIVLFVMQPVWALTKRAGNDGSDDGCQ
jgi:hypothetical protein